MRSVRQEKYARSVERDSVINTHSAQNKIQALAA